MKKDEGIKTEEAVTPVMKAMKPGDTLYWPLERECVVRSKATQLGRIYERVYSASSDRDTRTISVTRIS